MWIGQGEHQGKHLFAMLVLHLEASNCCWAGTRDPKPVVPATLIDRLTLRQLPTGQIALVASNQRQGAAIMIFPYALDREPPCHCTSQAGCRLMGIAGSADPTSPAVTRKLGRVDRQKAYPLASAA